MEICLKEASDFEKQVSQANQNTFEANIWNTRILDNYLITTSVTLQKELPGHYNNLIKKRSNGKNAAPSRAIEILRQYPELLLTDLRTIAEQFPTDEGNLTRIRDLFSINNDFAQAQNQLTLFAQNTKAACIDYEQYFDWLKNAHIAFVKQLGKVKNDQLEKVLLGMNGLHFYNFIDAASQIYTKNMKWNVQYRMEDLRSGWSALSSEFFGQENWLKKQLQNEALDAMKRSDYEEKALEEIALARKNFEKSLDVLLQYFSEAWTSHMDELKPVYEMWETSKFKSFSPAEINIAPVAYMKVIFLVNQQAFFALQVFNKY